MNYFEIGFYLAIVTAIALPTIILKRRFFKDNVLDELYEWWDGHERFYDKFGVVFGILALLLFSLVVPLLIWVTWAAVIPLGLLAIFINKARNRRIKKLNNK
jgi:hypothetical protein